MTFNHSVVVFHIPTLLIIQESTHSVLKTGAFMEEVRQQMICLCKYQFCLYVKMKLDFRISLPNHRATL